MNRRLHWEPLFLACVAVCLDAQCQKRGITCLLSKTHPPWHLTGQWRDIIARVWISDTALSQQMRAGRHSAPQQLCLLTSSVINGGYKVHGNDILHHHKPLRSPWQRSDPQLMWRCLLFRWFLFNPVSLCGCSLWLWHGSERLLHEERWLSVPPGLPEASRHALQQLQGVCGGRGGDGPGEDLPSRLLCLQHLQVSLKSSLQSGHVSWHRWPCWNAKFQNIHHER